MSWIHPAVRAMVAAKALEKETHVFVVCSSEVRRVVRNLQAAFPENSIHAFAAKANCLRGVLQLINSTGMACETASYGEFRMAQLCFPPDKIVFDSPVKTMDELRACLYTPCFLNVDNFQELERVAQINAEKPIAAVVGVRINPQLGEGTIGCCSTALATSKFGIGLDDARTQIKEAFNKYPFLKMLHVHTGSQGIGFTMMVEGVKKITEFALEIGDQVRYIDIGGGLPVNFASDEFTPTFSEYSERLRAAVPVLFTERFQLITEFGRAVIAKAGFFCSRVEYTKVNGGRRIVQQHVGADLCVRTVWAPQEWPLRVELFDADGTPLTADPAPTDVAGPCCLGGDLLCKNRDLPAVQPGGLVVAKDVGGYYYSSFSIYNLRQRPPAYLFDEDDGNSFTMINRGQKIDETLASMDF